MKHFKLSMIALVAWTLVVGVVIAQKVDKPTPQKEKVFELKLNAQKVNTLFYCLSKSKAEHDVVAELQKDLEAQIVAQIDTAAAKK